MSQTDINSNVQTLFSIQMQDIKKKKKTLADAFAKLCRGALSSLEELHHASNSQARAPKEPLLSADD